MCITVSEVPLSISHSKQSERLLNTFDVLRQTTKCNGNHVNLKNKLNTFVHIGYLLYDIVAISYGEMCREGLSL